MGILKDLFFGSDKDKETRKEKTERVEIRDYGGYKSVYDSQGHWREDLRWNPESGRWDKLDSHGDVTGHIERNVRGDMVHTDYRENVTGIDKREGPRTVSHYDSKGNKTGYTTKDYSNNLTRHTYEQEKKQSGSGHGLIGFLTSFQDAAQEYERKVAEIRNRYGTDDEPEEDDDLYDKDDLGFDLFDDEDDDPYADEYDDYDDDEYDDEYDDGEDY